MTSTTAGSTHQLPDMAGGSRTRHLLGTACTCCTALDSGSHPCHTANIPCGTPNRVLRTSCSPRRTSPSPRPCVHWRRPPPTPSRSTYSPRCRRRSAKPSHGTPISAPNRSRTSCNPHGTGHSQPASPAPPGNDTRCTPRTRNHSSATCCPPPRRTANTHHGHTPPRKTNISHPLRCSIRWIRGTDPPRTARAGQWSRSHRLPHTAAPPRLSSRAWRFS
mmetsp:Transcript_38139/g.93330  ORF Transcript_38139/g.93330 Transcript_38139/m.93330 type:complete len:219 (-) Transcript_38139:954-1610(-)